MIELPDFSLSNSFYYICFSSIFIYILKKILFSSYCKSYFIKTAVKMFNINNPEALITPLMKLLSSKNFKESIIHIRKGVIHCYISANNRPSSFFVTRRKVSIPLDIEIELIGVKNSGEEIKINNDTYDFNIFTSITPKHLNFELIKVFINGTETHNILEKEIIYYFPIDVFVYYNDKEVNITGLLGCFEELNPSMFSAKELKYVYDNKVFISDQTQNLLKLYQDRETLFK